MGESIFSVVFIDIDIYIVVNLPFLFFLSVVFFMLVVIPLLPSLLTPSHF